MLFFHRSVWVRRSNSNFRRDYSTKNNSNVALEYFRWETITKQYLTWEEKDSGTNIRFISRRREFCRTKTKFWCNDWQRWFIEDFREVGCRKACVWNWLTTKERRERVKLCWSNGKANSVQPTDFCSDRKQRSKFAVKRKVAKSNRSKKRRRYV